MSSGEYQWVFDIAWNMALSTVSLSYFLLNICVDGEADWAGIQDPQTRIRNPEYGIQKPETSKIRDNCNNLSTE